MDSFEQEEKELLARLAAIRAKREEEEARVIANAHTEALAMNELFNQENLRLSLKVTELWGMRLRGEFNRSLTETELAVVKTIPRTFFKGFNNTVEFDLPEWEMSALPKLQEICEVTFLPEVEAKVHAYLNEPRYVIGLTGAEGKQKLKVQCNAQYADYYVIRMIAGARNIEASNNVFRTFTVPLSEGWDVFERIQNYGKRWTTEQYKKFVVWEDGSLEIVIKDVTRRSELDRIVKLEDFDYDAKFVDGKKLHPFQRVTAEFWEQANGRAIVGHQMGLGKTPISLAPAQKHNYRTLIVCPASLKENWVNKIHTFTGKDSFVLSGSVPSKLHFIELMKEKKYQFTIINFDILGAAQKVEDSKSGEDVNFYPWPAMLNHAGFDYIIIDEAHYAKSMESHRSRACRELDAKFIMLLTGTPIINRPGELWPLLHMVDKEIFNNFEGFVHMVSEDGGKSLSWPDRLKNILKPYMIRYMKKDVQKDLPPINRVDVTHGLSEAALSRYNDVLKGIYRMIDACGNEVGEKDVPGILAEIIRLKQVCSADKTDKAAELAIEHYDNSENGDYRKVIIFSQFVDTVRQVAQKLGGEALILTGETPMDERMNIVRQFQTDNNIHFICCTSQVAREGLDLDAAGAVIFVDYMWAPAHHEQCEGRAYGRLSNSHSINSYYLPAKGTIEDWIQELLTAKFAVIEGTVNTIDTVRSADFGRDILKKLIQLRQK